MNVFELYDLAAWFKSYFKALRKLYNDLQNAVANNATQSTKLPIEEPLVALTEFLAKMEVGQLSLEQLALLDDLGVQHLVGPEGASWITSTVKAESYDPATTNQNVTNAVNAISEAYEKLSAYEASVTGLGFNRGDLSDEAGRVTVRVGFRNDAAIRNVKDWKVSADDWFQIIRGLALAADEAPEDTKVVGATTGSIVLVLSATYAVSKLLATIAKHITSTAKDILNLQITAEELRQKKMLTKAMEAEFDTLQKDARSKTLKAIEDEVKALTGKVDGEKTAALSKAIEKLLKFGEQGGDVDFVAPPESSEQPAEGEAPNQMATVIQDVRRAIVSYQEEREAVKLLSDQTGEAKDT